MLQPASPFYKTFAIECSRAQVAVDMFLFSAAYQDVATLGTLSRVLFWRGQCSCDRVDSMPPALHLRPVVLLPRVQRVAYRGRRQVRARVRRGARDADHVGGRHARSRVEE